MDSEAAMEFFSFLFLSLFFHKILAAMRVIKPCGIKIPRNGNPLFLGLLPSRTCHFVEAYYYCCYYLCIHYIYRYLLLKR